MSGAVGYDVVRVLPDLARKPWNDVTRAYLRSLRPSEVRVVPDGGEVKSDAKLWRVTVFLTSSNLVSDVVQEVEVDLPDGVAHAHALRCRLDRL